MKMDINENIVGIDNDENDGNCGNRRNYACLRDEIEDWTKQLQNHKQGNYAIPGTNKDKKMNEESEEATQIETSKEGTSREQTERNTDPASTTSGNELEERLLEIDMGEMRRRLDRLRGKQKGAEIDPGPDPDLTEEAITITEVTEEADDQKEETEETRLRRSSREKRRPMDFTWDQTVKSWRYTERRTPTGRGKVKKAMMIIVEECWERQANLQSSADKEEVGDVGRKYSSSAN
jgi:hypothetical protein